MDVIIKLSGRKDQLEDIHSAEDFLNQYGKFPWLLNDINTEVKQVFTQTQESKEAKYEETWYNK